MRGDAVEPGSSLPTVPGSAQLPSGCLTAPAGSVWDALRASLAGREDTFLSADWAGAREPGGTWSRLWREVRGIHTGVLAVGCAVRPYGARGRGWDDGLRTR